MLWLQLSYFPQLYICDLPIFTPIRSFPKRVLRHSYASMMMSEHMQRVPRVGVEWKKREIERIGVTSVPRRKSADVEAARQADGRVGRQAAG